MAGSQQTHAKRARELALKERRERKKMKKTETADERAASREALILDGSTDDDAQDEAPKSEWIQ